MKILVLLTLLLFISSLSNSKTNYLEQITNLNKIYNFLINNLKNEKSIDRFRERLASSKEIKSNTQARKHFKKYYKIEKNNDSGTGKDIKIFLEEYAKGCLIRNQISTQFPEYLLE